MSVLEDVERHRNDIVTDMYTMTWREVLGQYNDADLIINPDYQRLFRWDNDQQTQYIESILLAIPSPPLFFARNDDGRFEVIDGLQRISTVLKFFAADRDPPPPPDEDTDEREEFDQNDIGQCSTLAEGRIVRSLEGHTATSLPESLVRTIRYARISIILLEKESSKRARYEVFRRLNKFGAPLSDQEIRNCTARLLGREFPDRLRDLAADKLIQDTLALSEDAARRMGVEEALLRLLTMNFHPKPLKHQIREYLDEFMEYASEGKFALTAAVASQLLKSFELIHDAVPDGQAFRLRNQGFSTNLFDVVATGVFHNVKKLTSDRLATRHAELLASPELKTLIGAGSNTKKKMQGRIDLGKRWFAR